MNYQVLGKPRDRVDGRLKVTGSALYAGDRHPENLAYGYLVTSCVAKGSIRSMDTSKAEQGPGVVAVYTPFRPLKLYAPLSREEGGGPGDEQPPLQDRGIRFYGQIIGLVVANSFEQARDAAALIRTEYDPAKPVLTWDEGLPHAFAPKSIEEEGSTATVLAPGVTHIDDVIRQAPVSIEVTYREPMNHHNPMEPHATTAIWDGDRLEIYEATQGIISHRRTVASVLGVDEDRVHLLCPFVGGGFGCKGSMWMHSPVTAAAARDLKRPVKTVLTREQMFTLVGHRPALIQQVALAATPDGALQAVKHEVQSTVATSKVFIEAAAHRTSRFLYKSPNIQVSQKLVPLDVGPPTFMRAPGVAPGMFALECAMDELAVKLNLDPVELRMRNYAEIFPGKNVPWSSKNLAECYRIGAEKFGWSQRRSEPGVRLEGEWLAGVGMASALYPAHRGGASAKVRLLADGTAEVSSATQDLGTGTWTVLAMVGAEYLGLPVDRVRPALGDSMFPPAPVSGGSQTVASVGTAVRKAAESAIQKLIRLAVSNAKSPMHGLAPETVSYDAGYLAADNRRVAFADVLNAVDRGAVEAVESIDPLSHDGRYAYHSFGAQYCEVKVNRYTAEVRVQRVTTVMDIGQVVNLKTARSQVMGGVVFGIGLALLEQSLLETGSGRFANANMSEYLVATNADVPYIDVAFVEKPDLVFSPVGARGVGEIGISGIPAAVANAVYNATGKRVREFPITPEKLLLGESGSPRISVI
ncbi:MAG: xanthine dehydrogenase family protein molybdopterin-binding subunit [Verrucomicrobia bacterium]|nr:xanthine dehydrogenase family protein molybdopterin-binding subunit [Verrucomicrobiota bacterium]